MRAALQPNPIVVKELRSRMRGARPYLILTAFLLGLSAVCYGIILIFQRQAENGMVIVSAHVGQGLFAALALAETLLITFLTPAVTAGAISSEREQLTYDLLIATPLRPGRILSGKLVAAMWYVLLLIFTAVPLGSVILLFGGVSPRELIKALLLLLLTALATGMLGLLCSAIAKRTLRATIMAYLVIIAIVLGSYFWVVLRMTTNQFGPPITSRAVAANPFSAMTSIVLRGTQTQLDPRMMGMGPMMFDANVLLNMPPFNTLTYGLVSYDNATGMPLIQPMYRYAFVGYTLWSIGCYWLASHFVRPRRRWRVGWHDLLMIVLLVGVFSAGTYWLDVWPWTAINGTTAPIRRDQPDNGGVPTVEPIIQPALPMPKG